MKKKKILLIIGAITLITVITLAIILLNNNRDNKNKKDLSDNVNNTNIIDNEELEDIEEVEEETEEEESNEHKLRITPIDNSNNENKTNKQTITTSNKNSNINNDVDSSDNNNNNNKPQNISNNSKTNNDKNDIEITVKPTKTVDSTITVDTPTTVKPSTTKQEYKCPSGYTLDGNMCYKEVRPRIEYLCGFNQTEASGYCLIDTSTYADVSYSCPDGYSLNGNTCYKEQITGSHDPKKYENMAESLQRDMYTIFQNSCRGTIRYENGIDYCYEIVQTYANATYSCPSGAGELAGDKCISIKVEKAFEKYYCDEGTFNAMNKVCVIKINAEKK